MQKKQQFIKTKVGELLSEKIDLYSLDMIISVGYRVKSNRATQFRIWANNLIKEHLIQGYTLNEKRLKQTYNSNLEQLGNTVSLLSESFKLGKNLHLKEARGFIEILTKYTQSFIE